MLRILAAAVIALAAPVAAADFRLLAGHGGPIHDIAVSDDGRHALTASFDNSVGFWDLESEAVFWLEGHEAAVKSAIFLPEGQAASGGDDFAVHIWDLASGESLARLEQHRGQIAALAVSPDGSLLASASWDGTIGLWNLAEKAPVATLEGHRGAVNDVAFSPDGATLYSGSADGTIRTWDVATTTERRVILRHGFGVTTLVAGEDWLVYGAVDGGTRIVVPETAEVLADLTLERRPILDIVMSPQGDRIAVGDGEGFVMTVSTDGWLIDTDYQAAAAGPVWALAFTRDGESLISGGVDDAAFVWPVENVLDAPIMAVEAQSFQTDPAEMTNGERQFRRKCSICHSLTGDGARRAGPTLEGLFGRAAGSVPGYAYSSTVEDLDIEWNEDTIDALFDLGPDHYIPGSKMPMQRIVRPEDRRDLIEYLKKNT